MSVRVVARIRPLLKAELDRDLIVSTSGAGGDGRPTTVRVPNPKNEGEYYSFRFNGVYSAEQSQQELFDGEVAPTVKHLFNGTDVTLFAYGVTGTGKTHTMRGGKSLADRGVIPRMLSAIYRRARKVEKEGDAKVDVSMSYYEIYNDRVYDLFEGPERRTAAGMALRDAGGRTVVVGLTERPCESLREFEKLYDQANVNRSTSATKLNAHSSRSHAILCVKVAVTRDEKTTVSTASAIDLAGSEDNRRTDNSKERLVESSSINRSLFVLAQCVEAISKKAPRVPYRESKMTRILSLGQNQGITVMILNLSPVRAYHLDTLSSLNFANRTKKIEIREAENEPMYKGSAKTVALAHTVPREPLRALTSANHNSNVRKTEAEPKKLNAKPKAFAVYCSPVARRTSSGARKPSPLKRTSEHLPLGPRPLKQPVASPASGQDGVTEIVIEQIVEKKVNELLTAKMLEQDKAAAANASNHEIQRRLQALEEKMEASADYCTGGMTSLTMAKQDQMQGDNSSALNMYEIARTFPPDNPKIDAKISKLRFRLDHAGEKTHSTADAAEGADAEWTGCQPTGMAQVLSSVETSVLGSFGGLESREERAAHIMISPSDLTEVYETHDLRRHGEMETFHARSGGDVKLELTA